MPTEAAEGSLRGGADGMARKGSGSWRRFWQLSDRLGDSVSTVADEVPVHRGKAAPNGLGDHRHCVCTELFVSWAA